MDKLNCCCWSALCVVCIFSSKQTDQLLIGNIVAWQKHTLRAVKHKYNIRFFSKISSFSVLFFFLFTKKRFSEKRTCILAHFLRIVKTVCNQFCIFRVSTVLNAPKLVHFMSRHILSVWWIGQTFKLLEYGNVKIEDFFRAQTRSEKRWRFAAHVEIVLFFVVEQIKRIAPLASDVKLQIGITQLARITGDAVNKRALYICNRNLPSRHRSLPEKNPRS